MIIEYKEVHAFQLKFFIKEGDIELGRASLVVAHNDLHDRPFGLLEDVFVAEEARGKKIGNALVQQVIQEAKQRGCYKLIATSRFSRDSVHNWYVRLGFDRQGIEFRMNL